MPVLRCKMYAVTISAALTAVAGVWNVEVVGTTTTGDLTALGTTINVTESLIDTQTTLAGG